MGRGDGDEQRGTASFVCCGGRCVSSPDRSLLWVSMVLVFVLNGHFARV